MAVQLHRGATASRAQYQFLQICQGRRTGQKLVFPKYTDRDGSHPGIQKGESAQDDNASRQPEPVPRL